MKILALSGGARRNGNTARVLEWILDKLSAEGHECEEFALQDKVIKGCLACMKCKETPGEVGCVIEDDATWILDKIVEAEVVLFNSPLYFWGIAGPLKTLIDRTYSLYVDYHMPTHRSLVEGQRQALLVTGAGGYENNAGETFAAFRRLQKPHISVNAGELFIGGCTGPENLGEEARAKAMEFVRKLLP